MGEPPYEIVVRNADGLIGAFGYDGLVRYCDEMIGVIDAGGRGSATAEMRDWFVTQRRQALGARGKQLIDMLFEVIAAAPASMTMLGRDGQVIRNM